MKHFIIILIFLTGMIAVRADEGKSGLPDCASENQKCLVCHGKTFYDLYNSDSSMVKKRRMCDNHFVDANLYYDTLAVHREFYCIDCHDEAYLKFPHELELRFSEYPVCLDCHGGDETFAKYNFEGVEAEYNKSIHEQLNGEIFNCWSCHNPHGYIVHARNMTDITDIVTYNNNVCLSCHANVNKLGLISDRKIADVLSNHEWLPNQELHFKNVRCIECHTEVIDSMYVAHNIVAKDKATKDCKQCHSRDSKLMGSLYKYQASETRNKNGFVNGMILNEAYIIGANRSYWLESLSFIIFFATISAVAVHAYFRRKIKTLK